MMRRFWAAAGLLLGKHMFWVLAVTLVVSVSLGALGLPRLDFATGQDSYLNPDEQIAIDNLEYQDLFGGQAMISLFVAEEGDTAVDLLTGENLERLRSMEEELRDTGQFLAVVSPLTALQFTQNLVTPVDEDGELAPELWGTPEEPVPASLAQSTAGLILLGHTERDPEGAEIRNADTARTVERFNEAMAAGGPTFENPAWVEFLLTDNTGQIRKALWPFFPVAPGEDHSLENATRAQMVIRLPGNLSIEDEGTASDTAVGIVESYEFDGFRTIITGAPVLLKDLNDYLRGGMLTLGGIAVVIMLIVLWLVFRVRWRLLSLGVVLVGVLWAFSLCGLLGIPLSPVTISALPILIGMGVDFAIQVHNRVEEEVVLDKELHPMQVTLINLGPALVIATITAVFSFLALQLSQVPMIREFGVLLIIGICVLCAVGIVLPTSLLGMREFRRPTTEIRPPSRIEGIVVKIGSLPQKAVIPIMAISILVLFSGVLLEDRFTIETDPQRWVNQDTQVIRDLDFLDEQTGSSSELGYFLQVDEGTVFTDEVGEFVHTFAREQLDEREGTLLTASSLVTTVSFLAEIPGANPQPPTGEELEAAFSVAPEDVRVSVVGDDAQAANLIFRVGPITLEERRDEINEIDEEIAPLLDQAPGLEATASGLAVVGIGLLENLEANRALLTYVAIGLAAGWLLVRLRNPGRMVLAMVPVLLAVGASAMVIGLTGITLSPMTTVTGPLVVAACSEFSVLILLRYLEERREGLAPQAATDRASARTGRAFVASALTTIGGFAVLIFSALPLLRDFGIVVTLNIAVALASALVAVPPMLVWFDRRGWLRTGSTGTTPPPPGPGADEAEAPAAAPAG